MRLLALLTGNPLYTGLALLAILAASNLYVGYKAYSVGYSVASAAYEKRISKIIQQISDANAAIEREKQKRIDALKAVEDERQSERSEAEALDNANQIRIQEYEDEIAKRSDSCLLTDDDIKRLH